MMAPKGEIVWCPAVCGYLVKTDSLTRFADANGIRYSKTNHIFLRKIVADLVKKRYPKVPRPITTMFPRGHNPFRTPRYLMFATRFRPNVPHTFQFTETERDLRVLEKLSGLGLDMQILLTDTKFVTLPDPMDEMSLPGEQPGPEDKDYDFDNIELQYIESVWVD